MFARKERNTIYLFSNLSCMLKLLEEFRCDYHLVCFVYLIFIIPVYIAVYGLLNAVQLVSMVLPFLRRNSLTWISNSSQSVKRRNSVQYKYRISRPIRRTFFPEKCYLNSTCVLWAEGKYYFQTYKYPYNYYTTSLSWDREICFHIMRSGITACERLTFLSGDLP